MSRPTRAAALAASAIALALLTTACGSSGDGTSSSAAPDNGCGPIHVTMPASELDPVTTRPKPQLPVTVESADGKKVMVTDTSRVLAVNLYGSIAEIAFNLGQGDRLVGRDVATTLPEAADLPLVTRNGHDLSAEAVLGLDPTLVISDGTIGPPEVFDQLRRAGVPVVMIDDEQTLPNISTHIEQIATALGVPADGTKLVKRVDAQIADATAAVPKTADPLNVAFLYLRGNAGVYMIGGKGSGSDAMIEAVGAVNVGTTLGLEQFRPMQAEALVSAAPDTILVMTDGLESVGGIDGLIDRPGVAQTPAGENRRIISVDDGDLLNFGASTGRVIQALSEAVYRDCNNPTGE
jgi:iron complex transport system substrate-binding protein